MKKRNKVFLMAVLAILAMTFLAACGSRAEETMSSGEMAVPEMSSEEILVSSIEFLLRDDEAEEAGKEEEDTDTSAEQQSAAGDSEEPGSTDEAQTEEDETVLDHEAVIYYGNGASSELSRKKVEVKDRTPEEVLKALAKHNIVSLDTKLLAFEEEDRDGTKALHIDLSRAAGEYLRTMSMEAESIIISSVTNTFLENFDAQAIRITVAGNPLTSTHKVYEEELRRCTPGELLDMIKTGSDDHSAADTEGEEKSGPAADEKGSTGLVTNEEDSSLPDEAGEENSGSVTNEKNDSAADGDETEDTGSATDEKAGSLPDEEGKESLGSAVD